MTNGFLLDRDGKTGSARSLVWEEGAVGGTTAGGSVGGASESVVGAEREEGIGLESSSLEVEDGWGGTGARSRWNRRNNLRDRSIGEGVAASVFSIASSWALVSGSLGS